MGTLIIITLIIAGLLLFAVEVFLIPGISLAGIASGGKHSVCDLLRIQFAGYAGRLHHSGRFRCRNRRSHPMVHAVKNRGPAGSEPDSELQAEPAERAGSSGR